MLLFKKVLRQVWKDIKSERLKTERQSHNEYIQLGGNLPGSEKFHLESNKETPDTHFVWQSYKSVFTS